MYQVLLDAPGTPAKRIQIARLGRVVDDRYGEFEITRENAESWRRNLEHLPGGRALVDFEHRSERKPRDSQAAGWITGIQMDGNRVLADVEWTPKGAKAIRSKQYLFVSPAYGPHKTEDGSEHEDTLVSVALTNKPALGSLPALTLAAPERLEAATDALKLLDVSQEERDRAHANGHSLPDKSYPVETREQLNSAAILAASKHGDWKAARKLIKRRAAELGVPLESLAGFGTTQTDAAPGPGARTLDAPTDVRVLLDLPADADDQDVARAIRRLRKRAAKAKPIKTLAAERGLVLMSAKRVRKLETQAAAHDAAEKQLHAQRFEHAFDSALRERRVTPAEKDQLHRVYKLDADAALSLLDSREPIMLDRPRGAPAIDLTQEPDTDPQELMRAGVHPANHDLDQKVKTRLRELGQPITAYPQVLEQVMREEAA